VSTLSSTSLYWALLDTSCLPRRMASRRPSDRQLGYLFEPLLPVPLESIYAAYIRLPNGKALACGAEAQILRDVLASGATSLTPETLPPFLADIPVDPSRINLLTGAFEPHTRRAGRRRRTFHGAAAILLTALLLLVGLERRTAVARAEAREAEDASTSLISRVLPEPSPQPAEIRLVAELRRLRQTRGPASAAGDDASESLAALLSRWPRTFDGRVESLIVTPAALTVTLSVADHARADQLIAAVSPIPGWGAEQPQVRAERDLVRISLRFSRSKEARP
jgi:hypothetical protein